MNKPLVISCVTVMIAITGIFTAEARPEYARKENAKCGYCHLSLSGGGARGFRGMFYGANGLSFAGFQEEREALIAGVAANTNGKDAKPAVGYVGNISGPASNQIQLASLRGPVLAIFLDGATDQTKGAVKLLKQISLAYGGAVTILAVGPAKSAASIQEQVGQIRVLPDPDGKAAKKFGATRALDLVVVSTRGDSFKLIEGYSKAGIESAIAQVGLFGVAAPTIDLGNAPATIVRGGKIGS